MNLEEGSVIEPDVSKKRTFTEMDTPTVTEWNTKWMDDRDR